MTPSLLSVYLLVLSAAGGNADPVADIAAIKQMLVAIFGKYKDEMEVRKLSDSPG